MLISKSVKLSIFFIFIISGSLIAQPKTLSDSEIQFKKLLKKGIEVSEQGEYSKALEYLKKAETLTDKVKSKHNICVLKNYLGNVYGFLCNYGEALGYYKQALNLKKEIGDYDNVAMILNNIGWIYAIDNDNVAALKSFEDAYEITKKHGVNGYARSRIAVNIAGIYNERGEFKKAQHFLLEVENVATTEEIKQMWKANYAESLLLSGQIEKAEKIASELLEDVHVKCYTCVTTLLVKIYEKQNKKDLAIFYALKGLKQTSNFEDKKKLYDRLSKIYADAGDFPLAFKYKDSVVIAKDSIYARINRGLYEANKVNLHVQEYQNELQVRKERQSAERILFIVAAFFTIIIFYFIYRMLRNKITKQKQEKIIADKEKKIYELELESLKNSVAEKNRSLSAKALYLSGRNELIEEVINSLSQFPEVSDKKEIANYMKTLRSYIKSDTEWDDFIAYFEQVNPEFIKKLAIKYPDLNSADIRFLCYIYMNLDVREIGNIFNITYNATAKRIRRIREKMKIDRDITLHEYLVSLC